MRFLNTIPPVLNIMKQKHKLLYQVLNIMQKHYPVRQINGFISLSNLIALKFYFYPPPHIFISEVWDEIRDLRRIRFLGPQMQNV